LIFQFHHYFNTTDYQSSV